jgi:AcrR family transcriptional regulator
MSRAEAREPIWARPEPASGRAAYTRADIAAAAIRIADAEGLDAVSMRRVAAELGAGTMSLYHYVRDKDDLVALMTDLVVGDYLVDDTLLDRGWREGLSAIAHATRAALRNHRWVLRASTLPALGPNTMAHVDQTAHAAAHMDVAPGVYMEIAGMLDEYVFGCLMHEITMEGHDGGVDAEYWQSLLDTGAFPHISSVVAAHAAAGGDPADLGRNTDADGRFARGLERVLDGVAAQLQRGR